MLSRTERQSRPRRPVPPRSPLARLRAAARLQQRQHPRPHGGSGPGRSELCPQNGAAPLGSSHHLPVRGRKCTELPLASEARAASRKWRAPFPAPSCRPKMAPLDLDKYVEIARLCKYLPENDLKVGAGGAGRGGFGRAAVAVAAGAGGSGTLPVLLVVLPTVLPQRLCDYVCDLLLEESNVQPVSTPVTVCGDIHGQVTARRRDTPQRSVPPPALTCAPSRSSMTCASCSGPAGRCLTPTTSSWYVPVPPCSSQLASGSDPCRVPARQQHSAFPPPAAALGAAEAAVPGGQSWASRAGLCSDSEPPVGSGGRVLPGRLQPPKETASGFFVHRGVQDRCVALHFSVLVFLHL